MCSKSLEQRNTQRKSRQQATPPALVSRASKAGLFNLIAMVQIRNPAICRSRIVVVGPSCSYLGIETSNRTNLPSLPLHAFSGGKHTSFKWRCVSCKQCSAVDAGASSQGTAIPFGQAGEGWGSTLAASGKTSAGGEKRADQSPGPQTYEFETSSVRAALPTFDPHSSNSLGGRNGADDVTSQPQPLSLKPAQAPPPLQLALQRQARPSWLCSSRSTRSNPARRPRCQG